MANKAESILIQKRKIKNAVKSKKSVKSKKTNSEINEVIKILDIEGNVIKTLKK